VDHTGTTPTAPSPQAQDEHPPATTADAATTTADTDTDTAGALASEPPGFQSRGRARRRARFLRKARELAYRDLGGLVFNLHRFGQRNDALVLAKLTTLTQIDGELRTIERVLGERRALTVLREAGITACPRCAAIHSSEDSFCPNCGMAMGRHADLPIAGAPTPQSPPTPASQSPPAPASQSPPAPASQPSPAAPVSAPAPRSSSLGAASPAAAPVPQPATPPPAATADDDATEIIRPPASDS
jgi:hypothetical protein